MPDVQVSCDKLEIGSEDEPADGRFVHESMIPQLESSS